MNKLKRYLLFLVGLFINALGVSLVTKASLGTFIDLTMAMFFWVNPQNYVVKLIALLAGCIVLGFGVYMEVLADVVMLPGESFVRAIVQTWNTNFGTTKIAFDSSMTIIAGALSFLFFGTLNGVREGTIIAALLVGFIARLFGKHLEFIKPYLFPEEEKAKADDQTTAKKEEEERGEDKHKNVIVIGRQYGSGGHDIGKIFDAESKVIRELADKGNCVIIGRCSDYVLRDNERVL